VHPSEETLQFLRGARPPAIATHGFAGAYFRTTIDPDSSAVAFSKPDHGGASIDTQKFISTSGAGRPNAPNPMNSIQRRQKSSWKL
jgi:hypothetical protein